MAHSIISSIPIALARHRIITDDDGAPIDYVFLEVNPAFEELTGLRSNELKGKKAGKVLSGDTLVKPDQLRLFGKAAMNGTRESFEYCSRSGKKWYEVQVWSDKKEYFTTLYTDITDRKKLEKKYGERRKELNVMYDLAHLSEKEDIPAEEICQAIADHLPGAFQYPEIACCRLVIGDHEYKSGNFKKSKWTLNRHITISGEDAGNITVGYLEHRPTADHGPFHNEEKKLLDVVADWTGQFTLRKQSETQLKEANAIINRSSSVAFTWHNAPGWPVSYVSENVKRILGYTVAEFLSGSVNYLDCIHPDDAERVAGEVGKHSKSGKSEFVHEPYRLVTKDGEVKWVNDWTFIARDAAGSITHFRGFIQDITRHKEAEDSLLESEERFRTIFEIASLGIAQVNPKNGKIILVNSYYEEITGYSREELLKMKFPDLTHPDDQARDWEIFQRAARGEIPYRNEKRYVRKDGSNVWVQLHVAFIRDESGQPVKTVAICENITERKMAEAALKQSEEKYRMLVENQTDLVVKVDTEGRFLYVSPSYCKLFGKTEQDLLGKTFMPLVHEDDREAAEKAMRSLHEPPYKAYVEQRALTIYGWRWLIWTDTAILDGDDNVEAIIGVGRDITKRKENEELLKRQGTALESAANGIVITDQDGNIVWVNRAWTELTGYTKREALGRNPRILKSGIHDEEFYKNMWDKLRKGVVWSGEMVNRKKDGSVYDEYQTITPMTDSRGNILNYIGIKQDITERKKHDEQLKKSLDEKTNLLQELYHRTKNNMQVISSMLMIHAIRSNDEQFSALAQDINNRIKSMSLVHQKLYENNNLSSIPFREYIGDLFNELCTSYLINPDRITLKLDVDSMNLLIDTAVPCGLVLNELISNSFKHAFPDDRKGAVTIKAERDRDHNLKIYYHDNGIGLPPDFDQVKNGGMGWELIHMIVQYQLGGTIICKNDNGLTCNISFTDDRYRERVAE